MAGLTSPAVAEVAEAHDDHFITRAEALVAATPKETWLTLISPARWWSGEHTWSADAANLRLTPQAGGCFCETIPEVEEPGRFTLEGSVEHMRVIQAYPEVALRMSGALGPLQSEPVTGILTIAISEADTGEDGSARTRIVWEYNVGGKMRYPVPVISQAVDGVMTLQLTRLAEALGAVELPKAGGPPAIEEPASEPDSEGSVEEVTSEDEPEAIDPDEPETEIEAEDVTAEPSGPSVEEAFEDLAGNNTHGDG
ncbi:MAG: SRPBCC family protein [Pseudomonadota bacterium]